MTKLDKKTLRLDRPSVADSVTTMSRAEDTAYHAILSAIVNGDLRPGERLPELELAEKIGVSRTPVREAMNRLRTEGLILRGSNRRNYVVDYSEQDLSELFEIRALLEGFAAGRAAKRINDSDLDQLVLLNDEMVDVIDEKGTSVREHWNALNFQFHLLILEASDRPRLVQITKPMLNSPQVVPAHQSESLKDYLRLSCQQHNEIILALRNRNAKSSTSKMRKHLLSLAPDQTLATSVLAK